MPDWFKYTLSSLFSFQISLKNNPGLILHFWRRWFGGLRLVFCVFSTDSRPPTIRNLNNGRSAAAPPQTASTTLSRNSVPSTNIHRQTSGPSLFLCGAAVKGNICLVQEGQTAGRTDVLRTSSSGRSGVLRWFLLHRSRLLRTRRNPFAVQYQSIFTWSCHVDVDFRRTLLFYFCNDVFLISIFLKLR